MCMHCINTDGSESTLLSIYEFVTLGPYGRAQDLPQACPTVELSSRSLAKRLTQRTRRRPGQQPRAGDHDPDSAFSQALRLPGFLRQSEDPGPALDSGVDAQKFDPLPHARSPATVTIILSIRCEASLSR
eukprot:764265-Hanusia_phi.AAC.1